MGKHSCPISVSWKTPKGRRCGVMTWVSIFRCRRCETLPTHPADRAGRSSSTNCGLAATLLPSSRHEGPCAFRTTVRNTLCRGPQRNLGKVGSHCWSIPTHCRSSAGGRRCYRRSETRPRRHNPSLASPNCHAGSQEVRCPTESAAYLWRLFVCGPRVPPLQPAPTLPPSAIAGPPTDNRPQLRTS